MKRKRKREKPPKEEQKYQLILGTDPLELTPTEIAALIALTAQLARLTHLPDYDPCDVTLALSFGRTGHSGCAKMELASVVVPNGWTLAKGGQA